MECIFKEIKLNFITMHFKGKIKPFESPIGTLYNASMIPTNLRNSSYPNQISLQFKYPPPSLDD